ncbi:MAG: hypothetical protein NC320_01605, partial [Clostridium sp.]|nr:hypothetical protein [Clostridium sp.]
YSDTFDFIVNSPTIESEPMRHGKWISNDYNHFHCSECQHEHDNPEYVTPYCPICGAKMEETC